MISNMIELKEAKVIYKKLIESLHSEFESSKRFGMEQHLSRKDVYVIEDDELLTKLKLSVKEIVALDDDIKVAVGKKAFQPHPLIRRNVDYARIWANRAQGGKKDKLSKDDIIKRLEHKLTVQKRLHSEAALQKQVEILTQISYFKSSDEEQYILKSAPSPDCIIKLYFSDGSSERVRLTKSGLFLVGVDFKPVTIAKPEKEKLGPNSTMDSIYARLKPIPYFCSVSGSLYPATKVEELRKQIDSEKVARSFEGLNSKNGTNELD
ncbi:hypothetical protein [Aliivibrio salmonicida]|uniref:hypothetical protein n=1 Tax=Aliivibrio salmonicida TaxID=40269 RepID=UPI003D0F4FB0